MPVELFAIASGGLGLVALVWMVISQTRVPLRIQFKAAEDKLSKPR